MINEMQTNASSAASLAAVTDKKRLCEELGYAVDEGKVGGIVAKHEKMIVDYYEDVLGQAKQSFDAAKFVARIGFFVLIATLGYTLILDALSRIQIAGFTMSPPKAVLFMGGASGILIEFIAGVHFWLYRRASRQFGAFHICLERTYRYLLAYKIAQEVVKGRDEILGNLVCIMANAPMISKQDIETVSTNSAIPTPPSAVVKG